MAASGTPPAFTLTPELAAGSLRLTITVGGAIRRSYGAVILAPELCEPAVPRQVSGRLAMAWLPDYDETALRDRSCKITVQRNLLVDEVQPSFMQRPGTLVSYDAASRIAVVAFMESFPYSQDGQVKKASTFGEMYALLPLLAAEGAIGQPGTGPVRIPPISQELVNVRLAGDRLYCDRLAEVSQQLPRTIAILGADGGLAGFAMPEQDASWRYRQANVSLVDITRVRFSPESVQTGPLSGDTLPLNLKGKLFDIFNDSQSFKVAYRVTEPWKLGNPGTPVVPVPESGMPLALDGAQEVPVDFDSQDGEMHFSLKPQLASAHTQVSYELQVVARSKDNQIIGRSIPFGVTITRTGVEYSCHAHGIKHEREIGQPASTGSRVVDSVSTNPLTVNQEVPSKAPLGHGELVSLRAETKITRVVATRGGRELLLKLEGAPYWKRLSLEKRDWLPLPAEPLEECRVAGNEESLFVLVPKERRLTRYDAATLQREVSIQIPEHLTPVRLAAGAVSTHGPIALVCEESVFACDPKTLEMAFTGLPSGSRRSLVGDRIDHVLSGDGRCLLTLNGSSISTSENYEDYYRGFRGRPGYGQSAGSKGTVSPSIIWDHFHVEVPLPSGAKRKLLVRATQESSFSLSETVRPLLEAPLYVTLQKAQPQLPPLPTVLTLYSVIDQALVCSVATQELTEMSSGNLELSVGSVFFDPYSRSVAIWGHDGNVTVRRLKQRDLAATDAPILLNFPDGVAARGRKYSFAPEVLGPPGWKLQVAPLMQGMQMDERGRLTWDVPAAFVPSKVELNLKLVGPTGKEGTQFRHTLMIGGVPPLVAYPAVQGGSDMASAVAKIASGEATPPDFVHLESWIYNSPRRVVDMSSGLNEYVTLRMEDGTLELYSTKDRRVVGSYRPSAKTGLFLAGDYVLAYEPAVTSLTRLSLPDFKPELTVTVPERAPLKGLAVGTQPDSPVSLVLDYSKAAGFNGKKMDQFRLVVLENTTLTRGNKWAQPSSETKGTTEWLAGEGFGQAYWLLTEVPVQIPCSADGRVLCLSSGQAIVSPSLTTGVSYAQGARVGNLGQNLSLYNVESSAQLQASPTGDRLWVGSSMFIGARWLGFDNPGRRDAAYSRCGNYVALAGEKEGDVISLVCPDHSRTLMTLHNIGVLRIDDAYGSYSENGTRVLPCGDRNLIVVRNHKGSMLQFIKCDLPAVLKQSAPETVVVTSHAMPFAAQGRQMEYKITVNNPEAVATMRLRDTVTGAAVSAGGVFTYRAPNIMKEALALTIVVEIVMKDGTVIPHEFPLNVIAYRGS
ncbi:hypothetical protein [Verrucomicrobium sp. BvORR106]|uniref:hypothetical protein n=1 Tax=Verrucomicrobium sp. BvORR106 TaxID=1403819 RepID=UPI002240FF35|nr:hypothetical protein [Verrucomicrobium sp. BvORR106]